MAFPRPGRALKAILVLIVAAAIVSAVVVNWAPGGRTGEALFLWLAFDPARPLRAAAWLTSGIMTSPRDFGHAFWSVAGLYFLGTDLERRWGAARFVFFFLASVVLGNAAVTAANLIPVQSAIFHPTFVTGPMAAITACAIAWARHNSTRSVRLFLVMPVSGKTLLWVTLGFATAAPLFGQGSAEGAAASFGGIASGLLFGGTNLPVIGALTRALRRSAGGPALLPGSRVSGRPGARGAGSGTKGGPTLRIVQGGLEEDLNNRKPPKDKRFLN